MGAPTIVIKQFDVFAKSGEIESIFEIVNGEWSRKIVYEGYDYTVLISNRFLNLHDGTKQEDKNKKKNQHSTIKYWTIGVTPRNWGKVANDPLNFGHLPLDSVHVIHYPQFADTSPCVAIGWIEGFEFTNRTHIKLKMHGYQSDLPYAMLCVLGDMLVEELTNYGIECRGFSPSNSLPITGDERIIIEHFEQHIGTQTNINGSVTGPVASGKFQSATTFNGGKAEDRRTGSKTKEY